MERNLPGGVEVVTPALRQRLWEVLDVNLSDCQQAWVMSASGDYHRVEPGPEVTGAAAGMRRHSQAGAGRPRRATAPGPRRTRRRVAGRPRRERRRPAIDRTASPPVGHSFGLCGRHAAAVGLPRVMSWDDDGRSSSRLAVSTVTRIARSPWAPSSSSSGSSSTARVR